MFNLENKITWKELAPSLQAMFKTLQSQITDVKNEVNNINISLGDINDHLTQIDNSITNIEGDITNINNDISEINNNIEEVTNITNNITGMFATGEQGQVVKIDAENNGLFADDNFRQIILVKDNDELNNIFATNNPSLEMKNIFDNWKVTLFYDTTASEYMDYSDRAHRKSDGANITVENEEVNTFPEIGGNGGENIESWRSVLTKKNNSWIYKQDTNTIRGNFNYSIFSAFIQNQLQTKENYYIELYVNCEKDDDHFCVVFGYMTDDSGKDHTLSFIKASGYANSTVGEFNDTYYNTGVTCVDSRVWSAIVYDFLKPTQKILFDNSASVGRCTYPEIIGNEGHVPSQYIHYEAIIGFRRIDKYNFEIKSSKWSYNDISKREDPEFYSPYTLSVNFPNNKPSDWDQTTWNNVQKLLDSNIFGLGNRSCISEFNIREQQGVFPVYDEMYYLPTGEYYKWDYSTEKFKVVENKLSNRIFLYDDTNNRLYYYYEKGNYVQIKGGYST